MRSQVKRIGAQMMASERREEDEARASVEVSRVMFGRRKEEEERLTKRKKTERDCRNRLRVLGFG